MTNRKYNDVVIFCKSTNSEASGNMKSRGFTLLELAITLAVIAVLAAIALPNMVSLIANNRITAEAASLAADIALARSEAARRGATVTVCPGTPAAGCSSNSTSWASGRFVFVDNGTIGTYEPTASTNPDAILRVREATPQLTVTTGVNDVRVSASGSLAFSGTTTTPVNFTFCQSSYFGRVVTLKSSGRVSTDKTSTVCP